MTSYHLDHLQYLETEAIHVMREVAGEFERPALLFFRRKGFHLPAATRGEGVSPLGSPAAVAERRYRPPFPRAEHVPRHAREGAGARNSLSAASRTRSPRVSPRPPRAKSAAIACRSPRCSRRSRSSASTVASAARAATRKRPAPRSASSVSATASASGTRKTSGPRFGISTTAGSIREKTCARSR